MKGSLIVILFFCVGCIMGALNKFQFDTHTISMYILYALMLQVGVSIGSNKNLKTIISHLHPKMLLIPLGTIIGTLLFSALASILVSQWSVFDCMAVGSGFAYYSGTQGGDRGHECRDGACALRLHEYARNGRERAETVRGDPSS